MAKKICVIWSDSAKADLKDIYDWIKLNTQSTQDAVATRNDIINKSKDIVFLKQYQIEELLGEPYRRMVVRHYKIVYKVENDSEIRILKIFDTHKHPDNIKR